MSKATLELQAGDRVLLPGGLVRTVAEVVDAGYLGRRGDSLLAVKYREGSTSEWSGGNLAASDSRWELAS